MSLRRHHAYFSPPHGAEAAETAAAPSANRWVQAALGVVCMFMIANLQFGWTVFVNPLSERMHWSIAAIQVSFTIFVLVETWLVPFEAALVDKWGPRVMVVGGGLFSGLGWVCNGQIHSLAGLYAGGALAGIGAGMIYGTCVPNAVKWFSKHRGLAAGITVAGFGAGAAVTVMPLVFMIQHVGPFPTFTFFGIVQGAVIVFCGLFLVSPPRNAVVQRNDESRCLQGTRDMTLGQTLGSPVFWVMYVMFTLVAASGLMAVAQLAPIAKAFHIGKAPIHLLGLWTVPALLLTLQLNNIVGGIARPLLGWISDYVGREKTLCVAFVAEGIGVWAFSKYGHTPVSFILLAAVVFFAWGEIYSIFPSLMRDHFGQRYAATNYGALYTAKGIGSLLVPISGIIAASSGGWSAALYLAAAMNIVAAILAAVLWPLRVREISHTRVEDPATAVATAYPSA
ncbi:MAG TPA: oxalate/formate MFS antiporter [Candidatus Limnocylindria bacterium]|nr:oxalate/formate MFS antiporter [Candidatus Limnocylindria bacterium]